MDTLQQLFITVITAFAFFVLIAKIASAVTNGAADRSQSQSRSILHLSNVLDQELKSSKMQKSISKTKSMKRVRFALDHDEFVANKSVAGLAGPSGTKSIVTEKDRGEIEEDRGNEIYETADYVVHSAKLESVSTFNDYEQTKGGKTELDEGKVIRDENVANCNENHENHEYHENQTCMNLLYDDGIDEAEKEKEGLISEEDDSSDDDWEGVERSDLEKLFSMAADYGKLDDNLQSLENDIQMQLYALHKVATEGPCHEAQPMALMVSARAKWNSWQKLGNMSPDVAMERYIALLSELVPGWSQKIHSVDKH